MKVRTKITAALAVALAPLAFAAPASASTAACMDRDPALSNLVKTSKPPLSASSTVHMTNLMFVLDAVLVSIDRNCRAEPDYAQTRAEYKKARDTAYTNCRALAGDQSVCVPTRYVRPGS